MTLSTQLLSSAVAEPAAVARDVRAGDAYSPLDVFFRPRSIAVIGASRDRRSMSGTLLGNLAASFQGPIYPVNPHAAEVGGRRAFASIADVPGDVDLAFIVVPAVQVIDAARQCMARRVRGLVVISAGFAETGDAGRERQVELRELVRRAGIALVGPNCLGVLNTEPTAPLNGTFSLPQPPAGNVAVCSQSGALGFVFPEYMRQRDLGISQFVSVGNKFDIGENDLLAHWEHHDRTSVIQLYLESFQDPRRFLEVARRVARSKPMVALKAGRTSAGERAAGSHTAALASPEAAADGLFRQSGVIRVETLQELFETTALLAMQPLPAGRHVAVLTNAGGPGVLCADALEAAGLALPEFSTGLQTELRGFLPAEAGVRNPIDLIGTTDPERFRDCLEHLLRSCEIDSVVVLYVPRLAGTTPQIAQAVRECAAATTHGKTLLTVFMENGTGFQPVPPRATDPQPFLVAGTTRIPCYQYPEAAARGLRRAVEYAEWRARAPGTVPPPGDIASDAARQVVHAAAARNPVRGGGWLDACEVLSLLRCCGLPTPEWFTALREEEAVAAAEDIGFPVAVKVLSPTVLHKTYVGGVVLDVRSADEVRDACSRLRNLVPDATGILLQQFIRGGVEVLIGVRRDPAFGHLIGFGIGGVLVEALGDVRFRLHPLTDRDADELIQESLAERLLTPRRGRPAADVNALREALLRVSALVALAPEIHELDLNPVSVLAAGDGVRVLDARIFVGDATRPAPGQSAANPKTRESP